MNWEKCFLINLPPAQVTRHASLSTSTEADETAKPPIPEAGDKGVWIFKAQKAGTSTIHLEYIRPLEECVNPAETFDLTAVVE